jgi:glutathione synthase/RimK-type ligase-like ATP-grasp enzyme
MHIIIVDRKSDFRFRNPGYSVVNNREFIARPELVQDRRAKIINLSRDYSYLGYGYYCSLLAEARGQRVVPSVKAILELRERSIYSHALPELDDLLRQQIKRIEQPLTGPFTLHVFFGRADDVRFRDLGRRAFDEFRCPLLKINVDPEDNWSIASLRPMMLGDIRPEQDEFFDNSLEAYTRGSWRSPKAKSVPKYTLAILQNPQEAMPPSSPRTLQKFVRIGEQLGVAVKLIERRDYAELAEYDALFIRETTAIDHHTFRFAKRAEKEGMPVIDDPTSILRCANKVFLAELLKANKVSTPKTAVIDNRSVETVESEIPYPIVLKIPDGSFSRGVVKVNDRQELTDSAARLFKESDVILAQEYVYTEFDWRIGVLRGQAIYACQYFMSRGHWQVVKHGENGQFTEGPYRTLPIEQAPPEVVAVALKAARLIGDGFYGVDLKETPKGILVIEVNDNPSIDQGCEDLVLKDDLYKLIIQEFIRRLEVRAPAPNGQGAVALVAVNGHGPGQAPGAPAEAPAAARVRLLASVVGE